MKTALAHESEIVSTATALDWVDLKHLHALTGQAEDDFAKVIIKELVDNAIDAAERAGRAPKIGVSVSKAAATWKIDVSDNGGGLSGEQLLQISDFNTRASSKEWRRTTSRGQQGNAWKTVLGIATAYVRRDNPHVREVAAVEVASSGRRWTVNVAVGGELQASLGEKTPLRPVLDLSTAGSGDPDFSPSTRISCQLPADISIDPAEIQSLLRAYIAANPHLDMAFSVDGETEHIPAEKDSWKPQARTSIHWYTAPDFARYAAAARAFGWTVSRLVGSFHGFSSKAVIREVLQTASLEPRTRVSDLDDQEERRLFMVLRTMAPAAGPEVLTPIGRSRFEDGTKYAKVEGTWEIDGARVPFIVEAALIESNDYRGEITTAINYSPTYAPPWPDDEFCHFGNGWHQGDGIGAYLSTFHLDSAAPFRLVLHLTCPRLDFRDRGKSAIQSAPELRQAVSLAVWKVSHGFYKREEAHRRAHARQTIRTVRMPTVRLTRIAPLVIPAAYAAAAGRFAFADARQIFYKARPLFQQYTSHELSSSYFIQTLLHGFVREHPEITASWQIYHDARGHLWEPHGGRTIPLGTEQLEAYLAWKRHRRQGEDDYWQFRYETYGPGDRYGTVLFIEKEGFRAVLEDSGLLDEFDVALMSTKGLSTTAARQFLQNVGGHCKLLALHDFDVAGMSIVGTLSRDTARFQFDGEPPDILDLGLRLDDVRAHDLPSEHVGLRGQDVRNRLERNGATKEEIEFLDGEQRVELNAFGNDELVDWIRGKLEHHATKVVPSDETLERAWAEAQRERIRRPLLAELEVRVKGAAIPAMPAELSRDLRERLEAEPSLSWDEALWQATKPEEK